MDDVCVYGSDSEDEMASKGEYIAALRMVHQLDGKSIFGEHHYE